VAGVPERGLRRFFEAAQAVAERVRVHVERPRSVVHPHPVVEPRAQRRLELGAEATEAGERLALRRIPSGPSAAAPVSALIVTSDTPNSTPAEAPSSAP
jgi:hypothetical protein